MAFELPALAYPFDALEPHIDAQTMEIHHDKHHGAYVTNLNKALEGQSALQSKSIDDLLKGLDSVPENIRTAVRNNGGGHWNHSMFWQQMKAGGGGEPTGKLADAIVAVLGWRRQCGRARRGAGIRIWRTGAISPGQCRGASPSIAP